MLFDENGRPKKRLPIWVPLLVVFFAIALSIIIIGARPEPQAVEPGPSVPPEIAVISIVNSTQRAKVSTTGLVSSPHQIKLVSRVSGMIESVSADFREGAQFSANDLLIKIEDQDYYVALTQAQATLASARQQLATEQGQSDQAARQWRDLGNTEANDLFLRKPQLASAEAQVSAAEAGVRQAQLNLDRTEIRAPFDGVISVRYADLGQFINAGTNIADISSRESLQIKLSLTQEEIADLGWQSRNVEELSASEIQITSGTGQGSLVQSGRLKYVNPLVDPTTQMTEVTIDIDEVAEANIAPSPGEFVQLSILGQFVTSASWIPASSLFERGQVLIANDNEMNAKEVNVLASSRDQILVTGLEDGDLVVVNRPLWIFPGQAVTPVILNQ